MKNIDTLTALIEKGFFCDVAGNTYKGIHLNTYMIRYGTSFIETLFKHKNTLDKLSVSDLNSKYCRYSVYHIINYPRKTIYKITWVNDFMSLYITEENLNNYKNFINEIN